MLLTLPRCIGASAKVHRRVRVCQFLAGCPSDSPSPQRGSLRRRLDGMNFLAELFQSGASYSAVNTAWSALSSILLGSHPLVSSLRLLKGVFNCVQRYTNTKVSGTFSWLLICWNAGKFRTFPLNI